MDNEVHYLTYDPDELFREMNLAYIEAGGDVLHPGDEKENLMRGVQAVAVQIFAAVDNALRMDTLRYAVGEYLDIYGEKRGCPRITASAAKAEIEIVFRATGVTREIAAGTTLTADGQLLFALDDSIQLSGQEQNVRASVTCTETGSMTNALPYGTSLQFVSPLASVLSATCVTTAKGGEDAEDDETYRARIRTKSLSAVTTGPAGMYEEVARGASGAVIDAKAIQTDDGEVTLYLIIRSGATAQTIIDTVSAALNDTTARPLTDSLIVTQAEEKTYTLNVNYVADTDLNTDIQSAIEEAVTTYMTWQNNTIGRAFNPDKLVALLYQAGATRVTFATGSEFDGGDVEYTAIGSGEKCGGTISVNEVEPNA